MPRRSRSDLSSEVAELRSQVAELLAARRAATDQIARCDWCGEPFLLKPRAPHQRFCSAQHRTYAYRARRSAEEPGWRGSHGVNG